MDEKEIEALARRMAWRYAKSQDPHHSDTYTFNRYCLLQFAGSLLAAAPAPAPQWQPIETAPVESEVLAWFGPRVGVKSATYTDKDSDGVMFWCVTDGKFGPHPVRGYLSPYPTHWMPLPEPPEGSKP